jgi:predicted esterase
MMSKRRITQREIGFTQGVAYAAALMNRYHMDADGLIRESGIPTSDFRKYTDESDLEYLEETLIHIEK